MLRSKNLILNPAKEFATISSEKNDVFAVNKSFSIPIAIIIALFALIGGAVSNFSSPANSFIYIGINSIILFFLVMTHIYISGKSIGLLGSNISSEGEVADFYSLSTYSQIPFFIIFAVTKLFPSLIFLIFIGLYTGLLFYTGTGTMTKIPGAKQLQFTILSIIIMLVSFVIFSELFTILYSEILEQFSTFDAL